LISRQETFVSSIESNRYQRIKNHVYAATETQSFTGDKLFNSIYRKEKPKSQNQYPVLQQHFIGWFIRAKAVLILIKQLYMDFQLPKRQHRFMYVLPTSTSEALLEYTLFSYDLLKRYETKFKLYHLSITIEITEKNKEASL
jgi:lycopene beta-cyclase